MGKYRSVVFRGFLGKEIAQEIADFLGVLTKQEAMVIVSGPFRRYHTHILATNEPVSDEDKAEINNWIKKEGEIVYRSRKAEAPDKNFD